MKAEKRYLECYSYLATVYSRMKDYDACEVNGDMAHAFLWYKKQAALEDSLFKLENSGKVAKIEAMFESQKKEIEENLEDERLIEN